MTNKTKNRFNVTPYLFVTPVFILLAALVVYPICYALYLSVLDTNLTTRWDFVGLKNYFSIFKNGSMVKSLLTTFEFTVVVVSGHLVLGTVLALAMNKKRPGVAAFRTILILPWLLPDVVVALLYKWIFNANYGVFNNVLIRLGIIQKNQAWLSTSMAFLILAFVCIWKGYALIMVNIMAGLQSVPEDIYEAADLDGASKWQTSRFQRLNR